MEGAFLAVTLNSGEVRLYKMPSILNPLPDQTPEPTPATTAAVAKDAKGVPIKPVAQITP